MEAECSTIEEKEKVFIQKSDADEAKQLKHLKHSLGVHYQIIYFIISPDNSKTLFQLTDSFLLRVFSYFISFFIHPRQRYLAVA